MACVAMAAPPVNQLQTLGHGIKVEPNRMAPARMVNGVATRIGDWVTYNGDTGARGPHSYAFDCYQDDGSGVPSNPVPYDCGIADGSRWYFGAAYMNPMQMEDMTSTTGAWNGNNIEDIYLTFFWGGHGDNLPTQCFIAFFCAEEMINNIDCSFADLNNFTFYDGVLLDYGQLQPPGGFYFYSNVLNIFTDGGIAVPLPMDSDGSYLEQILGDTDGDGAPDFDPTLQTQTMLWGTGEDGGDPNRNGSQDEQKLDDDGGTAGDPPSGDFQADECYSYLFAICPDPLGACNGFLVAGGCVGNPDFDGDGFVTGIDFDLFVQAFEAGDPAADYDGDGFITGIDFDIFVQEFESGAC
jgi:hypothetical protein